LVRDTEAREKMIGEAMQVLFDDRRCQVLSQNIGRLGRPTAAEEIVDEIEKLIA
jgi:UDP-N-acetylglucosamine--N-acetylmuramyl-(pentapeptide) pyrophosphoryl-undecaprenol N-acetylglucosamine transferase